MNEEKIKEIFSDEEFVKSLLALETPEEVQAALAEKDVDFTVEDIKKLAVLLQKKADGELADKDLENVAGGSIVFLITAAAGTIAGIVVSEVVSAKENIAVRRW